MITITNATIGNFLVPVVSPLVFLSLFLFLFLDRFFSPFSFCFPPPFYSFRPCSYHHSCSAPIQSLRDIFPYFISFLPSLSQNYDCWALRVLFRLSYVHLMRQRLGKNLLINAKVRIFTLLVILCILEVSRGYELLLEVAH